jgi:DHA3 family tetracycline resistance protein-like MFS transporter
VTTPKRRVSIAPRRRKLAALRRVRMLTPLRRRDFALLWAGMAVSLLGDGIYFVAIVWEALRLSNTAVAVSLVGLAWTVPTLACLLLGGALSDRFDRRRVMLLASLAQATAIGAIGLLDLAGVLHMWTLVCLVAAYGAGQAFFLPAFEALVPTLVDADEMTHASALDQFVRPFSLQLVGPALGGGLIALAGTGPAFLLDAATFLFGAATLLAMRSRTARPAPGAGSNALHGLGEAFRFVRTNAWLWTTLLAAALTLLLFIGPYQVLLPFLVKNTLHGSSATLGLIRALGGVGALVAALSVSQLGLPGWAVRAMFLGWAVQSLALAGYAIAEEAWLFAGISLLGGAGGAVGNVVWGVLMKTRVPNRLLGRVASLDWLVSIALVPVSFALTGPVAGLLGARTTLLLGGVVSAGTLLAFLLVAGAERRERRVRAGEIRTAVSPS